MHSKLAGKISRLSGILKEWMHQKMQQEIYAGFKNIHKLILNRKAGTAGPSIDEKFKFENFDLIVWDYIAKQDL